VRESLAEGKGAAEALDKRKGARRRRDWNRILFEVV